MFLRYLHRAAIFLTVAAICRTLNALAAGPTGTDDGWEPLFDGQHLDNWYIVISDSKSDDANHLVQVEDGAIHMYKDSPAASPQPAGYLVTKKEYSNYRLRLQYRWGVKRFVPRLNSPRDAGLMFHVVGKDGVWPRCVECQIQENDVGDVFAIHTRVTSLVDPKTTNIVVNVTTNNAGSVETNQVVQPVFLDLAHGGIRLLRGGGSSDYQRVIRNPMNEHEGWNTVEIVVRGDEATYIINGKVNNQVTKIEQMVGNEWVPLKQGKIGLQLEYAEVDYRNIEIQKLTE
jgi:hypothetical protein